MRKQHVTDGLSPKLLSSLLSEALPPLDEIELSKVADGFADLDRRRDHIAQLDHDVAATRKLVRANRDYARAVVGRNTTAVTQAQTRVDNVTRRVRELTATRQHLVDRDAQLEERGRRLDDEDAALEARLDGLHASEAYKQGGQLNLLRDQVREAKKRAEGADREAQRDEEKSQALQRAAQTAAGQADLAAGQARSARIELEQTAALLGTEFIELADESLASGCEAWIDARHDAVREVRRALDEHATAVQIRRDREDDRDRCEEELTKSEALLDDEREAANDALAQWTGSVAQWRATASELAPYFAEAEPDPAHAEQAVSDARRRAEEPLIERRSGLDLAAKEIEGKIAEAREECHAWAAGRDPEPEAPRGRRDRSGLAGSPFWRLVQFRAEVAPDVRGNLEAALSDSRLLDAWVAPDGELSLPDDAVDIVMRGPQLVRSGRTLADVLEPDPATDAVRHDLVMALLQSIPLADAGGGDPASDLLIRTDGTWRAHRLSARAASGPARFVGASSRAAARTAKIAELDALIAALQVSKAGIEAQQSEVRRRLDACEAERQTFPSPEKVLSAYRRVEAGELRTRHKEAALAAATERVKAATLVVQERLRTLSVVAARHELPTDAERLDDVTHHLRKLTRQVGAFERSRSRAVAAIDAAARVREQAGDANERATTQRAAAQTMAREAASTKAKLDEVDRAVGADYRDVLRRIDEIKSERDEVRREKAENNTQRQQVAGQLGSVETDLEGAEHDRARAEGERVQATTRFVAAAKDGLLEDAEVPEPPAAGDLATPTAPLEAARRARASGVLPADVDESRLQRLSNNVMQHVGDAERQLVGRADVTFDTTEHGWAIVRARRDGVYGSARNLLGGLRDDLDAARAELTRKQQELFEQILSGSVREHLRDRLWAAQGLVDRINAILGQVRTEAGGVKVTLEWEIGPDLDDAAELRRAKDLLLRDSPLAEGRRELDAFLQGRIERIRSAENDTGQWRDRLAEMLNYRAWHRFRVMVHHKRFGERPRALESRKVSLSAGEKTIVMVLPLLAAVTSHYEPPPGEPPSIAPRLLLMDELFPKLDYPNKRQLLGLLPRLDLDAVFTSDKDRCEYDTIDAIAIHVFQKLADDSSTTTRLVWNGAALQVAEPEAFNPAE